MAKVIHRFKGQKVERDANKSTGFILTNKKGSYAFFSEKPESRYQGFFFFDNGSMFKALETIGPADFSPISSVRNDFYSVERKRKGVVEKFFVPSGFNSLAYELSSEKEVLLSFDFRHSYDSRQWGRFYEVSKEKGCVIVKFVKKTDHREDSTHGETESVFYAAIKPAKNFEKICEWAEHYYKLDEERHSIPYSRHVFRAVKLKTDKVVVSVDRQKSSVVKECNYVHKNLKRLKDKQRNHFHNMVGKLGVLKKIKDKERKFALIAAVNSLNNLTIEGKNPMVLAGLPWFFQSWPRDELISLKALLLLKKTGTAEKILEKQVKNANRDGSFPNNDSDGSLNSADAAGWLAKRMHDFREMARKNPAAAKKLKLLVNALVMSHTLNNLALNNGKETWMDTISREGARIEIQALRLAAYKYMHSLTKQRIYRDLEERLRNKVLEKFWDGKTLADGLYDETIRPNAFIAFYTYPDLLSKKEWGKCFENMLKCLWLPWGGLATVDKKNPFFCKKHTGEDSTSYHNGDSWFWVNNLSAICMQKAGKSKFRKYVGKIIGASCREILWSGVIGHHSELSSASALRSEGCLMQAWSSAMLIEALAGIHGK